MSAPVNSVLTGSKGIDKTKHASADSSLASPTPSTASVGSPVTTFNNPFLPSNSLDGALRALNLDDPSSVNQSTASSRTATKRAASNEDSSSHDTLSPQSSSGQSTPIVVALNPSMNSSVFKTPPPQPNVHSHQQPSYWACTPIYIVPGQEWHDFGPVQKLLPGSILPTCLDENQVAVVTTAPYPATSNAPPRAGPKMLMDMDASATASDISMPLASDAVAQSDTDITMKSSDTTIRQASHEPAAEEGSSGGAMELDDDKEEEEDEVEDEDEGEDDPAIFDPVEIQQYAKSCHPFKEGEKTLGLPHSVYTAWNAAAYDHLWMENAGVTDKGILQAFISKYKMDELIGKGALLVGFELYIEAKTTAEAGQDTMVEKMARLVEYGSGAAYNTKAQKEYKKKLPDFELFFNGIKKSEFKRCDGPKDLLKALHDLEPKPTAAKGKKADLGVWKGLQVRHSDGTNLGSLYDVRQTYHRWEIEMDAWSAVTGTHTRKRRPYKSVTAESAVETDDE